MDTFFISTKERILSEKCSNHQYMHCDMLYMDPSVDSHRICAYCMKEKEISFEKVAFIAEILNSDSLSQIPLYPLTMNESFKKLINSDLGEENIKSKVKQYFSKLQNEVSQAIGKIFERENQKIENIINKYHDQQRTLRGLLSIQKIQELLLRQDEASKAELHKFITQHYSESKKQTLETQQALIEVQRFCTKFSSEENDIISNEIIDLISKISFVNESSSNLVINQVFQQEMINKWNSNQPFLPSLQYQQSVEMKIETNDSHDIIITNTSNKANNAISYIHQSRNLIISLTFL